MSRLRGRTLLLTGLTLLCGAGVHAQPPKDKPAAKPIPMPRQAGAAPDAPLPAIPPPNPGQPPPPLKPVPPIRLGVPMARLGEIKEGVWHAVYAVAFSPDGKRLVTGGSDKAVHLWDVTTHKELRQLGQQAYQIHSVAYAPDGKSVAVGALDGSIGVWDVETSNPVQTISPAGSGGSVKTIAFAPDGATLAVAGSNGKLRLLDVATGKERLALVGHNGMINAVAYAPDGKRLASVSHDRTIRLWDVTQGRQEHLIAELANVAYCVAFSPDGRTVATGGEDGFVRLWDVATGEGLHQIEAHKNKVAALAFGPDGKTLASGGMDSSVRLWETVSGKERRTFKDTPGPVNAVAFSPDGRTVASAGLRDSTAWLWDATGLRKDARWPALLLDLRELDARWSDLASEDAARAYRALWTLAAAPAQAVPLARTRLRPLPAADEGRVARLIADLDSDRYTIREQATRELEKMVDAAAPALRKVLDRPTASVEVRRRVEQLLEKTSGFVTSGERLRGLRGVEVLEQIGSVEARQVLEKLGQDDSQSVLAQDARAALKRLDKRTH